MQDRDAEQLAELATEMDAARAARAERDAARTPTERLERVDELCRQLAAIRPVGQTPG